ncbi:hypothetical protein GTO89_08405 [Heliobacterium gestii]|uniref:Flagellar protein FlgN n=1 Tax=Heliomicrobium gestii TaxID=2699 RepID=A0A845LJL3_HELGE|nr:flagellar protein FlgN [Heliomicrobium gestii]MBM7866664.1 flagellar biosynthesis/type III secretory pathway chaperone [Heliomicrobium gestii]MZP43056.1 hypothetical protein [Heliomicrobium gestii]
MPSNQQVPLGVAGTDTQEGLFEQVVQLLEMHHRLLKGLNALAQKKEQSLVKADVAEIQKLTDAENTLILQSGLVEKQRQQVTVALLARMGMADDARLSDLFDRLPPQGQERLDRLRSDINTTVLELERQNQRNKELIEKSLQFYDTYYDMLRRATEAPAPAYGPQGDGEAITRSLINRKI